MSMAPFASMQCSMCGKHSAPYLRVEIGLVKGEEMKYGSFAACADCFQAKLQKNAAFILGLSMFQKWIASQGGSNAEKSG